MAARIFSFLAIIVVVALARFIPHPPNFSPMLALALFAGAKAPNRWLGFLAPVLALWLGDLMIGTHYLMMITGLSLVLAIAIGEITQSKVAEWSFGKKVFG